MIKKIFNKVFNKGKEVEKEETVAESLKKPTPEYISFREGFDLTAMPIAIFYQGDKKLTFLLDTGANDCIIDKNILKDIDYEMWEESTTVFGLNGEKDAVDICNITLSYKDRSYPYSYLIRDMSGAFSLIKKETGVTLHGLLGSKFFNEYKYVLDFDELVAYSKL